nr:type II toxin-antitoxin system PemK/MazF family toxin [Nocardioides speluncae]
MPARGQVYLVDLGYGRKPWVVVSNNHRNRALSSVLAARLTTTRRQREVPTIIALSDGDAPLVGFVVCDDIEQLDREWYLTRPAGALTPATMRKISEAMRIVIP